MPTSNTLTDHQCRSAKPGEKARKLFDGHGMFLFISPAGAKVWRMTYREGGKAQTLVIGPYPLITLAEARVRRDDVRRKLVAGESPKAGKAPRAAVTLSAAVQSYWAGRKDVTESYVSNALRGLAMYLEPALGKRAVGSISKDDLLEQLSKVDQAGKHVYARRVRMWVSQVFDWAIEHGHAEINPAALIRPEKAFGKRQQHSHAALDVSDVPEFLLRLSYESDLLSAIACRLLALTWVRTTELRMMLWDEIDGDVWRIPEGKMKRRRDHLVPLSRQALEMLALMRARSRGRFVFGADHTGDRPISENTVLYLLHRMGYKGRMTGHGWRAVASTWANERGYNPDAIERQLAHAPEDKTRAAYNRAAYMAERRQMLQDWADWLDKSDPSRAQG